MADFPNNPATSFPSGGGGGAAPVAPGTTGVYAPSPASAASITSEIYEKYLRDRLAQVEIPQVALQRDELNQNASQFAVTAALNDARFKQLELPMADAQRQKLISDIADTAWQETFQQRQLDTQTSLQRAGLTLQAAKQASDEALSRDTLALDSYKAADQSDLAHGAQSAAELQAADQSNLAHGAQAQQGFQAAEGMDLARGGQASSTFLGADAAELDRERLAAQTASTAEDQTLNREKFGVDTANQAAQLGLSVAQANANLRGARNAFQQQNFNYGVNAQGLSKAVDALRGVPGVTAFQAPGAPAERATLATQAEDIARAGPGAYGQTAFDLMMGSANRNTTNPVGAGSEIAFDIAQRNADNPYSPMVQNANAQAAEDAANRRGDMYQNVAGQAGVDAGLRTGPAYQGLMDQAGQDAGRRLGPANQAMTDMGDREQHDAYNSPSANINMDVAGQNQVDAGPSPASQRLAHAGEDLTTTYFDLLNQRKAGAVYDHLLNPALKAPGAMDKLRQAWTASGGDQAKFVQAAGYDPYQGLDQTNSDALSFMLGRGETPTIQNFFSTNNVTSIKPDDPQYLTAIQQRTGLNAQDASQIAQWGHDFFAANGGDIDPGLMNQLIVQRYAQTNANNQNTDQAAANRAGDAYQSKLRETGQPYLSDNNPDLLNIYKQQFNQSPAAAAATAGQAADYYTANGAPIPSAVQGANADAARKQYPLTQRWATPGTPQAGVMAPKAGSDPNKLYAMDSISGGPVSILKAGGPATANQESMRSAQVMPNGAANSAAFKAGAMPGGTSFSLPKLPPGVRVAAGNTGFGVGETTDERMPTKGAY